MCRYFLFISLLITAGISTAWAQQVPDSRPNFLIIVTDDMGYTDLGAFGGRDIPTPNLDRLARDGMRLTNFHAAPSCAPTRAMLFTGTGNHEAGMGSQLYNALFDGQYGYEGFLQPRVATLPEVMQANGYHTMMSGKWHIGDRDPTGRSLPANYGFDRDYTLLRGSDNHYGTTAQARYSLDGEVHRLTDPTYSTIRYTDKLLTFLDDHARRREPFFAVYAPTAPHWPLQTPPGREGRFSGTYNAGFDALCEARMAGALAEGILPANAATEQCNKESGPWQELASDEQQAYARAMEIHAAMVAHLDEQIGLILERLEASRQLDNTWIIYMNDNGPQGGGLLAAMVGGRDQDPVNNALDNLGKPDSWANIGQGWADAISSPFRNTKGTSFEGGMRVAAFAWHNNAVAARSMSGQFLTVMDIMPTVLDLAGIEPPDGSFGGRDVMPLRGHSMAPLLTTRQGRIHGEEEAIALDHSGNRMMVRGEWKIVQLPRQAWMLFNMVEDPSERNDLAAAMPEQLERMVSIFNGFARERHYIEVNAAINQP